ncbi:hypothetical protein C2869_12445 [Saccharobesus litoralis]|uniref:ABM domain-containing protein n=1 Tax=Saccharobesus litoralis TaxID=2172099 RepID=A0A2S0VSK5_9ALTE|nr:hypothetical protein [Saccharobesus litoralis]AWB67194.1 hypothetical protein C2869_12445 [Saccharobesus litoralis]
MTTTVIELVTYNLKAGISAEQLKAVHPQVNDFLMAQDGFMYRSLSNDKSGLLYDIVYWRDMASAKKASEAFMASTAGQALCQLTDMDSVTMRHMPVSTEAMICSSSSESSEPALI